MLERNRELAGRRLDPVVRVRLMLQAYMSWGLGRSNAYQLVYSAPPPLSAGLWSADTVDLSVRCYEIFEAVVREIAAEGRLRGGAPEVAAQASWMSCHQVVALLCARPNFPWAGAGALMTTTLDTVMRGLVVDWSRLSSGGIPTLPPLAPTKVGVQSAATISMANQLWSRLSPGRAVFGRSEFLAL